MFIVIIALRFLRYLYFMEVILKAFLWGWLSDL